MVAVSADSEVFESWHKLPEHFRLLGAANKISPTPRDSCDSISSWWQLTSTSSAVFGCMRKSVNVLQTKRTRGILQHQNYGPEIFFTVFFLSSYLLGLEIWFHLHPFLIITFSDVSALLMATESRAVCDTRYLHCVHKKMKIRDFRVSAQHWKYVSEQQIIRNGNKGELERCMHDKHYKSTIKYTM